MKTSLTYLRFLGFALTSFLCIPASQAAAQSGAASGNHATSQKKSDKKPTAASLTADMCRAVTYIAIQAKRDMSVTSKSARPFWGALKNTSSSLTLMASGIKDKNANMLKGLNGTGRGVTQVVNSWNILRRAHPKSKVSNGVIALYQSYNLYLKYYGPGKARLQKGGKITETETAKLKNCKSRMTGMRSHLKQVAQKSKNNSHQQRLAIEQLKYLNELARLQTETLDGYAAFLDLWDRLDYTLEANANLVAAWYPDDAGAWDGVASDSRSMGEVFESSSWSNYENWDYTSTSIEVSESYVQETASVSSISETDISENQQSIETYNEASATEESAGESRELNQSIEVDDKECASVLADKEESTDAGDEAADNDDSSADNSDDEKMDDAKDGGDDSGDDEKMDDAKDSGDDSGDDEKMDDAKDSGDDSGDAGGSDDESMSEGGGGDDASGESMSEGGGDDGGGGGGDDGGGGGDDGGGGDE